MQQDLAWAAAESNGEIDPQDWFDIFTTRPDENIADGMWVDHAAAFEAYDIDSARAESMSQ